jgi:hypothetical protein
MVDLSIVMLVYQRVTPISLGFMVDIIYLYFMEVINQQTSLGGHHIVERTAIRTRRARRRS